MGYYIINTIYIIHKSSSSSSPRFFFSCFSFVLLRYYIIIEFDSSLVLLLICEAVKDCFLWEKFLSGLEQTWQTANFWKCYWEQIDIQTRVLLLYLQYQWRNNASLGDPMGLFPFPANTRSDTHTPNSKHTPAYTCQNKMYDPSGVFSIAAI